MNSKITLFFNNIPDAKTGITIIDTAYPNSEIRATFVDVVRSIYEVYRGNVLANSVFYFSTFLKERYPNIEYEYIAEVRTFTVTITSSNPLSQFVVVSNTTNGKVTTAIENNAGIGSSDMLNIADRTAIDSLEKITLANSPVFLRYSTLGINAITVYLWMWSGELKKELDLPNITLTKRRVSDSDNYISLNISDYLVSYLENPENALNTNQPNFVYNEATPPVTTGNGIFWQVTADITVNGETTREVGTTKYATLGYKFNNEQTKVTNQEVNNVNRWYNKQVPFYIKQSFNFNLSADNATSSNIIQTDIVNPLISLNRCSRETCLVVYLNKLGLWDIFTPHGKILIETDINSEDYNKLFRDPSQIDNSYTHSKNRGNLDVLQKYTINTGLLKEDMVYQVEEILYSPKVYLILFDGSVQEQETTGITIDNTFVTIDDINITIDSATVTAEMLGMLKGFKQVPVIPKDSNFIKKTRLNDKNEINYTLKFDETNNKILDII